MTVSAAALSFLILAATLGSQARVLYEAREPIMAVDQFNPPVFHENSFQPSDCCLSYTPRNVRCLFMEDYFETSSWCSRPGVVFLTKGGRRICADPRNGQVQNCMTDLKSDLKITERLGRMEIS
ncbi:C-C motif chemokine 23-like [Choloepus didactylus]|uniref:C-C motif chemokine 23-like n=1 Tax=Choloepus didactylus TaxID=27675 RepID=UPI00189CBBB3|nr:C-C motif chemokine 23-like [Choloepus didactylus]